MEITFNVEELSDYIIYPLIGDIPTITLSEYPIDTSKGSSVSIVIDNRVISVKLLSLSVAYTHNGDYTNSIIKCLTDIETKYRKYRESCSHPIMDNYPSYQLLENLVISDVRWGSFTHRKYTAILVYHLDITKHTGIKYQIEIQYNEETIYKISDSYLSPAKILIKQFTDMTLPKEFYILPSSTKSARKTE